MVVRNISGIFTPKPGDRNDVFFIIFQQGWEPTIRLGTNHKVGNQP